MSETNWGRVLGLGGLAALVLALGIGLWMPGQLREAIAEERQQSSIRGLGAAPAPNLPGRLDGNSVGVANNPRRTEVVRRWRHVGARIKSGELSRIPTEKELQQRASNPRADRP